MANGDSPTLRITVVDTQTNISVEVDISPTHLVEELIESVAAAWDKDIGAYALSFNNQLMQGSSQLGAYPLHPGAALQFMPDPQGG